MDRAGLERWWRRVISGAGGGVFDHAARGGLFVGTLPFEVLARTRDVFYATGVLPSLKLPVPVISFGNLTVGGTGKTPAVIWCARRLAEKALRPGIASRGYKPADTDAEGPNDEAELLKEALPDVPHVWNRDRATAGAALVKEHGCNAVILDDGFQHRRLRRTLDFLLIDAMNPFGYGHMLPRGLLREPVSALRRATAVIITRSNLVSRDAMRSIVERIRRIDESAKISQAVHRPTGVHYADGRRGEPETLSGEKVFAFCGIGNPHAFVMTLSNLGAEVVGVRTFDDHHAYSGSEIDQVSQDAASRGADLLITTQKDRVKIGWREELPVQMAELRVAFEVTKGVEAMNSALDFLASSGSRDETG